MSIYNDYYINILKQTIPAIELASLQDDKYWQLLEEIKRIVDTNDSKKRG